MSAEKFANAINEKVVDRRYGTYWTICPVCQSEMPSFLVVESPNGRIKVKCLAGCSQQSVIGGLKALNLWPTVGNYIKSV